VTVAGRLESLAVKSGEIVTKGQELARLSSIDLELAIADLEGKASQSRARLNSLERERFTDPAAGLEIGTVEESLKSVEDQLAKKRKDREELVLVAPRGGIVLPPTSVPPSKEAAATGKLPGWSGNALDDKNLGATFPEGTVLCMVGDADKLEGVMVVDQSEVEFITRGQPIDLKLDAFPWQTFTGKVDELAETHIETGSERLSVKAGGQVPTKTDESGRESPISTSYEAMMSLEDPDGLLTPGMRGTARIKVGSRTVGQWLLRLVWQTFNFRM
jgi:multidrug efflux pump subunit AcrA (membrane-fusion protein)